MHNFIQPIMKVTTNNFPILMEKEIYCSTFYVIPYNMQHGHFWIWKHPSLYHLLPRVNNIKRLINMNDIHYQLTPTIFLFIMKFWNICFHTIQHKYTNTKKTFNIWCFLPLKSDQTPTSYQVTSKLTSECKPDVLGRQLQRGPTSLSKIHGF